MAKSFVELFCFIWTSNLSICFCERTDPPMTPKTNVIYFLETPGDFKQSKKTPNRFWKRWKSHVLENDNFDNMGKAGLGNPDIPFNENLKS